MTINPKYKVGQKVWKFYCNHGPNGEYEVVPCVVEAIMVRIDAVRIEYNYYVGSAGSWAEHMLHATETEAFSGHRNEVQKRYDREIALLEAGEKLYK